MSGISVNFVLKATGYDSKMYMWYSEWDPRTEKGHLGKTKEI